VSLPLVAIERASGSVSEICLSSLRIISALIALSRTISSFSFSILLFSRGVFGIRHSAETLSFGRSARKRDPA
jgi:hypothetical protein